MTHVLGHDDFGPSPGEADGADGNQIGRVFIIDQRGTEGRLEWVTADPGGGAFRLDLPLGGGVVPGREEQRILAFVDPRTGQPLVRFVSGPYQLAGSNKVFDIDQQGSVFSPGGTWTIPSAGGGGRTFGEEQALLGQRQAFESGEAEKTRAFTLRLRRFQDAMQLTRDLVGLQQQARTLIAQEMGQDPFRGAIMAQGGLPLGRTPHAAFMGELRGLVGTEVPEVGGEATMPQIESTIGELEGLVNVGLPQQPLGFAHGGIVDMARGGDGTFSANGLRQSASGGETGVGVLTGEAGPEVAEFMRDGTVRFIPLVKSAQFGGLTSREELFAQTPQTRAQAILPIWERLGLTDVPIAGRTPAGFGGMIQGPMMGRGQGLPTPRPGLAAETFGALGVKPRLIFEPQSNAFLWLDPSGELRTIGSPEELTRMGLLPTDAVTMSAQEIREMGATAQGFPRRLEEAPMFGQQRGPFATPAPIISPLSMEEDTPGLLLPAPRLLAPMWRSLDPDTKRAVLSAYGLAGWNQEQVARELNFFTPGAVNPTAARTAGLQ